MKEISFSRHTFPSSSLSELKISLRAGCFRNSRVSIYRTRSKPSRIAMLKCHLQVRANVCTGVAETNHGRDGVYGSLGGNGWGWPYEPILCGAETPVWKIGPSFLRGRLRGGVGRSRRDFSRLCFQRFRSPEGAKRVVGLHPNCSTKIPTRLRRVGAHHTHLTSLSHLAREAPGQAVLSGDSYSVTG